MISWIYKLLIGNFHRCNHTWEILSANQVCVTTNFGEYTCVDYHLKCTKCGEVEHRRLRGGV